MKEWNLCKNYLDFNIILIPGLFFAKKYAMDQLQTSPTKKLHKKNHSPAPPTTAVFWHGLAVAACLKLRRFSMAKRRGWKSMKIARLSECVQYLFAETLRESSGQLNFSHFRTSWRKRNARKLLGLCGFMVFLCLFVEFSGHKGITSKGISGAFFWARNETQNELNQENHWLVSSRSGKENNSAVLAFKKFSIPIPHLADAKRHQTTCLQSDCDCF